MLRRPPPVNPASSTAIMPVTKIPSKLPAPPIERPGPEALKLIEIEQIGADQHAKAAAGIGQRRRVAPGDQHGDDGRGHRRDEDRQAYADAADRLRESMADRGDDRGRDQAAYPEPIFR